MMPIKGGVPSDVRKQESSHAYEKAPIAAIFEDCLQYFERIEAIEQDPEKAGSPILDLSFSRFRQWGSDTGAQNRALDHTLRKASQLQEATKDLLRDLLTALQDMQNSLQDAAVPQSSPTRENFGTQLEDNLPGDLVPSRASSDSDTSLQQLTDDVEECVSCLIKLTPALQDPAPQDIYKEHASHGEANDDIDLAKKMFPKATLSLLCRLGFANWKRKGNLLNLKLRDYIKEPLQRSSSDNDEGPITRQFSNMNVRKPSQWSAIFSSDQIVASPGSSYAGANSINETVFSKSDYFSNHSATSVSGSDEVFATKRFECPKPPVQLKPGSAFDCSYCGQEIIFGLQISSDDDWTAHVYLDLEPYMCTFDDCVRADRTFGAREDWFQHELDYHRLSKTWYCQSCNHNFDEMEEIEIHLSEKHMKYENSSQLSLMISLCERFSEEGIQKQSCPFCGYLGAAAKTFKMHVADHMEQLALTSIQSVHGSHENVDTRFLENASAEKKAKLEFLHNFVDEQRSYFWKPPQEQSDNGSATSNVAFAEDSEDEEIHKRPRSPELETVAVNPSGRPVMKRRGTSWMTKVNTFLETQPTEQPGKDHPGREPWLSKVQSYLETQSVQGQPLEASGIGDTAGPSSQPVRRASVGEPVVTALSHCLRTRPPPRNKDFLGRESDLARLFQNLSSPGTSHVVSGIGGMGKTESAIEYTYRYEKAYKYIFWISAETSISCADTYSLIATEFIISEEDGAYEQGRLITLGREFLEQTEMRWLLVFDNVTSWSDIREYIPTQPHKTSGSILITSRMSDFIDSDVISKYQSLNLQPLTLDESRRYLLNSMQSCSDDEDLGKHPEYKLAGIIAKEAEGLPLALSHIAGYIQVSECTLTDFVQLWNERRRYSKATVPTPSSTLFSTDKALEAVWNIGLREVTIDARELLNILAFLDSDNIQRKLLVGEHEEPSLDFLHSDQAFRYKRMISELRRRNIISVKTENDEQSLSIHGLLQQKILKDLDRDAQKREQVFSQAFQLVRKRFPLPSPIQVPEPAKWPACKEYLPHLLHFESVITKILPSIRPSIEIARLLSDGGINLWERGMTHEGLRLLKSAEAILDRLHDDDTLLRANIHVIINLLIQDYGLSHIAESERRSRKALAIRTDHRERTKPEDYTRNDDILLHNAQSDYGCVLLQYNRFKEAEPIFKQCLVKYSQWGSETDIPYEYYKYNHHSAFCALYRLEFSKAIELAEASLRLIQLATGQSSATSKTRFDLACIVFQSGDTQRAISLHKEVLESNLRQHGNFNFLTLQSYYAVGAMNAHIGNVGEAERWMRKSLSLERSRKGSWSEAANARTQFHLSQILQQQQQQQQNQQQQETKDPEEIQQLASQARSVLAKLLPLNPLEGVEPSDEIALFDHLQPVFDGRFVGGKLLKYVARKG